MHKIIKHLLSTSWIGFCVALFSVSGIIQGRSAAQVQADQRVKYDIGEKAAGEKSDRFTQTTAHLQTELVKNLMKKEDSATYIPYLDIIFDCLAKEQELKDTHYVFYHTTGKEYRLAQDVYAKIYAHKHPNQKIEDFLFLRFTDFSQESPKHFLLKELGEHGIVDNDQNHLKLLLLSVNLSLFGNIDWKSSSTWDYFVNQKLTPPSRKIYEEMMTKFGLTHKYIDELMSLNKIYNTKENALLQIFIPQNKVDEIGYLAWSLGMPRHEKSIAWVNAHIKKNEGSIRSGTSRATALKELAKKFEKNQKDPLFKNLLESVEKGDFSLDAFLKKYRNEPWEIEDLDHAQARLLFTPDGLLNPASDIQFYRYSRASKEQLQEYTRRLNEIMNKIFTESKGGSNV
ncbi:MAG TPA: hypothetical protein VJ201_04790 [Candidatus Babeliales bacterium]|nr:hypothetical protein [Candidatus Babeliales bacterium]